jgi:23S rRNA pseudouridine2605 synthase
MEPKKDGKSRKEKTNTSSKERKSRKSETDKEKSKKNPLREKIQSAKDGEKRKTRRDFFTKDTKEKKTDARYADKKDRDDKKRPFREKDDRKKSFEERNDRKRPLRENDDNKKTFCRRERDEWIDREERKPRKERRSKHLDSDIIREVVQRRHETGRRIRTPKVLSLAWSEERGAIRLNKYIANSGICSRREADDLITAGAILVNGKVETELGTKVMPTDEVRYEDKILQREKPVYILLNKPKNFITTTDDEKSRDNVMMLIEGACSQRVYPVGRLDRDTTGLLLFTNDGEMTKKLTHPRYGIKKIYQVGLDKNMSSSDFEKLANGIELEDGLMKPDDLAFVDGAKNVVGITLHSGKNRIVRRLFARLGYEVEKLDRVYYAGLTKKDLPRGEWRFLRQEEINI